MKPPCLVSSCTNASDYDDVNLCKMHREMQGKLFRQANRKDRRRKAPSNPSYTKKRVVGEKRK